MINIAVNEQTHVFNGDPAMPLLWFLRDVLKLKGTKYGCGVGVCGICTVLIDGEANHACMVPVARAADHNIVTIEGLVEQNHTLLHTWIKHQVPQCGYCQPGQIMAAAALLNRFPNPTDEQIVSVMSSVLCRCGTYQRIRRAIDHATQLDVLYLPSLSQEHSLLLETQRNPSVALDEWIRIADNGVITVLINHAEMGQGIVTGLAMLVAEELDADINRLRTEFAPVAPVYRNPMFHEQTTGGSTTIRGEWQRLRMAGAKARWRLIEAAAQLLRVPHGECRTQNNVVYHDATQRSLGYGELASRAARITAPGNVALKTPDGFRLLGRSQPRLEIPLMVTARAVYGTDVVLDDMLCASVARRPASGVHIQQLDMEAAKRVNNVCDVIEINSGVAVLANSTWAAMQGRQQLDVVWQNRNREAANNKAYQVYLLESVQRRGETVSRRGNVGSALSHATEVVEATYETSFLAHATLETMNCTARLVAGQCDVWVSTQSPEGAQSVAAQVCGLPKRDVHIHSTYLGGGFGRRLESDYVADAVELSAITRKPVQVLWTRADDMQHDYYRPAHVALLKGGLDAQGRPVAWWQRSAGDGIALEMVEVPYDIPNVAEERVIVESPLPTGAWRSVGAGQSAFVVESFIDELAHAAGRDPLQYRLELLANAPRSRAVLQYAAEKARWGIALPENCYQGIAQYQSFGSWVAHVAELSVQQNAVHIHRIVSAIDCGQCVNPDAVCAQIESAVAMGLSAVFKEQVIFENASVMQTSLEDYPILKFGELPPVEVHIIPSDEPPGGVGEPGLPPMAPAVANALFAATGKRLRKLPFGLDLV